MSTNYCYAAPKRRHVARTFRIEHMRPSPIPSPSQWGGDGGGVENCCCCTQKTSTQQRQQQQIAAISNGNLTAFEGRIAPVAPVAAIAAIKNQIVAAAAAIPLCPSCLRGSNSFSCSFTS
jgi:hypothetical protein